MAVTAGIAMHQSIHTDLDARPGCAILQGIDPVAVDQGLLDTHWVNVAYKLHKDKSLRSI